MRHSNNNEYIVGPSADKLWFKNDSFINRKCEIDLKNLDRRVYMINCY